MEGMWGTNDLWCPSDMIDLDGFLNDSFSVTVWGEGKVAAHPVGKVNVWWMGLPECPHQRKRKWRKVKKDKEEVLDKVQNVGTQNPHVGNLCPIPYRGVVKRSVFPRKRKWEESTQKKLINFRLPRSVGNDDTSQVVLSSEDTREAISDTK
jgi:hypothetical protein